MADRKTWGQAAAAGEPLTEAFALIETLARAERRIPVGFWQFTLDGAKWRVTVNGSERERDVDGMKPARFHTLVERFGWPVMILTPFYGDVLGSPDPDGLTPEKIEAEFLAALRQPLHRG